VNVATDGESYGHHHTHGDMALAYALHVIEEQPGVQLTNYGEFLERFPPTHEVQIFENTAWSCAHGIERWRSDCGCNSGRFGWNQAWRKPLRAALDWLRDTVSVPFEKLASELLTDPWAARNEYIEIVLDRSPENIDRFLKNHAARELGEEDVVTALKLLELQRHAMHMFTSCGWFFDEISGIESVQVLAYAGRVIQIAEELTGDAIEEPFLALLEQAKSNLPEHKNGRVIYDKWVKPLMVDWEAICAHYAVSSLFETYEEKSRVFCYEAEREDYHCLTAGKAKLVVGRARLTSAITRATEDLSFGVLHFGDHNVNGGVRKFQNDEEYQALVQELSDDFQKADFPAIIRLFDKGFGESTYSLRSLFRDEQRDVIKRVLAPNVAEAEAVYRKLYQDQLPTMRFLAEMGTPLPRAFQTACEFVVSTDLFWALKDDEPDIDHIRTLLSEAEFWHVPLDTAGLAYRLKRSVGRLADRLRAQPADLALLQALDALVALTGSLTFEVDLWHPQNAYCALLETGYPEFLERALLGEEEAQAWLERFQALGEKLGIQVGEVKKKLAEIRTRPTLAEAVDESFSDRAIPRATYRLQFHKGFTFRDAEAIAPYLNELGISDVYASPILRARPGSGHGYDICDHSMLNPELGTEDDFNALSAALKKQRLGLILDTVPNHMGIGPTNGWWMDVLENGPASIYAAHFDIDWHPANPSLDNKVLIPVLEDQYGKVLESSKIRLAHEEGAFFLYYYEHKLPVAPRTYSTILEQRLPQLDEELGEDNEHVQELRSILTALSYLPAAIETSPEKIAERNREKEVIKRRIATLLAASPEIATALEGAVTDINGKLGEPDSFDALDALLDSQSYRPAFWRVATEEINYRRFFDINELAAICVERPEVFQSTHELFFRLLAEGKANGLRIDHPDGLWDPTSYFRDLQKSYVIERARQQLGGQSVPDNFDQEAAASFEQRLAHGEYEKNWPLYVVAEKILSQDEALPREWAVYGTSGYDYLIQANSLFVAGDSRDAFDRIYKQFVGTKLDFHTLIRNTKKMIMLVTMASEINALSHQLDRIAERNRRFRDFTLNSLTFAIREIIASMRVYRTYITGPNNVSLRDRLFVESAVAEAKKLNPRTAGTVFDFICDSLLLRNIDDLRDEDRQRLVDWAMKFQQVTGPVMAKGVEDTAFYVYNRLSSLNEVGGEPDCFGITVEHFHDMNVARFDSWPHSMLASSTHDTKRSEDVRARLNVLAEVPDEWQAALARWGQLNAAKKDMADDVPAPDRNDEYLLYQTLLGAWPTEPVEPAVFGEFRERIAAYMQKAINEAKVHTSWINPNHDYNAAVRSFVERLLPDDPEDMFRKDVAAFQRRLAYFGYFNALSQVVLKLTCPGVPDVYQGTELWDFSLVDPDNRRPVDYGRRRALLSALRQRIERSGKKLVPLVQEMLASMTDGRIKLYTLYRLLQLRRERQPFFAEASYHPLEVTGARREHVCAFARVLGDLAMIVMVPRLPLRLTNGNERPPLGPEVWGDTAVLLPEELDGGRAFSHLFTGENLTATAGRLSVAAALGQFPVALLEGYGSSPEAHLNNSSPH
ncbi:MAG: malto-oligosyltrehalose synthase, partial [Gemmataceae bacterium]